MKLVSWNIRGCNHPRKMKTLARKIKQEKPTVLFLQETKCSSESMEGYSQRIWKGCRVIATDAKGMSGGMAILWQPSRNNMTAGRANTFSVTMDFAIEGRNVKGTLVNIYGPSAFAKKQSILNFLRWQADQASVGSWVLGGDFNLITSLLEKKGGRRELDKFQEAFGEILTRSALLDVETGNGWFTWNNKRGGASSGSL